MKRLFTVLLSAFVCLTAFGQQRIGAGFGTTTSHINGYDLYGKNSTQDHIGLTCQFRQSWGFTIQPSLMYQVKSGKNSSTKDYLSMRYLEVPVGLQWGPDLLLFRPYLELTPFAGYAVSGRVRPFAGSSTVFTPGDEDMYNPFEYGLGIGFGVEYSSFQVSFHHFWNHEEVIADCDAHFGTGTFTLTYFFQ